MSNAPQVRPPIDVSSVIDQAPMGSFHWSLTTLCFLCLLMDGFDTQAVSYTGPFITREWKIASALLGPVFGANNFGVLVGSLTLPMLADRIGRRPLLIAGTLLFGVITLVTGFVGGVGQLIALRFVGGVGLGSIIPNATALMNEYIPVKHRVPMVIAFGCGMNLGGAVGGLVATALIPHFGWRSVFFTGGALPLVLVAAMVFLLPESLQFLVLRGRDPARQVQRWLRGIDPALQVNGSGGFVVREPAPRKGVPLPHLFRDGRAGGTVLLWLVTFMNLLNLYLLSNWLPTIVRDAGLSATTALLVGVAFPVGGTVGTLGLALGVVSARRGTRLVTVLTVSFALAAVSIALTGQPGLPLTMLFVTVFVSGWCISGSQPGVNTLSASYYPTELRSTGIGASLGVGRVGAIVGPVLVGFALSAGWTTHGIFYAAAVPAAIATLGMIALRGRLQPQPHRH
jgi:AAHS family 4-hydroxybenzoate transporter-like MFS transporter